MIQFCKSTFVLLGVLSAVSYARADAPVVTWPSGWEVETVPQDAAHSAVSRQRAVKNDEGGTPVMVMELTMTQVESGHQVNLQGVLLEMRKSVQKDFFKAAIKVSATKSTRLP